MRTFLKVAAGVAVLLVGYGVYKTYSTERKQAAPTRADALAAFEQRKANLKPPPGAVAKTITEAQRQAWADGWLASAARGNTKGNSKTCDQNIEKVPGKPVSQDLAQAWADGYFSFCGIHLDE